MEIYEINGQEHPGAEKVLEALRQKVATIAGVSLCGNRLTVRWTMDEQLVDVHMVITRVTTPAEAREHLEGKDYPDKNHAIAYMLDQGYTILEAYEYLHHLWWEGVLRGDRRPE